MVPDDDMFQLAVICLLWMNSRALMMDVIVAAPPSGSKSWSGGRHDLRNGSWRFLVCD